MFEFILKKHQHIRYRKILIQCFRIVLFVCGLVKIHTIELKLFSDVFDLFVYKLTKKKKKKKKKGKKGDESAR